MNREIEERIVAMYFDNEDFERNARQTINTLGDLKKNINFEDSGKSFQLFEKIGETLKFDKANQGLQKMKTTLSSMKNIFSKIFNATPIDDAIRSLNHFKNTYLDRVIGFDIAHKLQSALESAFRNLTIAPISAGWNQYESKMDSVRTIMSSTGESMETVEEHLQLMTDYANQTIYSLTDMTSSLGKFTNNGVGLKDATRAMMGIANATADAGQGAQQASMAMYNISQAMGVGKMLTIDWKSLENANIATVKLKNTFIQMAAAQGQLKKVQQKDGSYKYYYTKDSNGKELKDMKRWTEVNAQNFRETLSTGWLDKESMLRTFLVYSGEGIDPDTLASWGITDPEEVRQLMELGQQAREAATQVRTFTKMMDALREAAQSGWAETFQIIFGDMEEGTNLWTRLNGFFDNILTSSAEARNSLLRGWKDTREILGYKTPGKNRKGFNVDNESDDFLANAGFIYGRNGREILIDAFLSDDHGLLGSIKMIASTISDAFHNVFGTLDSKKLFEMTQKFEQFAIRFREWLGSADDSESRLGKLRRGLEGLFSIVKTLINFLKMGFNLIKKFATPLIDLFLDLFGGFGDFFNGMGDLGPVQVFQKLGEGLKKTWEKIKGFFSPKDIYDDRGFKTGTEIPAVTWLKNVWGSIKSTVRSWAYENGIGEVLDSAWSRITEIWNGFTGWLEESGIGKFFSDTWTWLCGAARDTLDFFTMVQPETGTTGFVAFINSITGSVESAWNAVVDWFTNGDGKGIWQFFTNTWEWIKTQFTGSGERQYDSRGFELNNNPPIVTWFEGIWQKIKLAWYAVESWGFWGDVATFLGNTWEWITSIFKPQQKSEVINGERREWTEKAPIVGWLEGIWKGITDTWDKVKGWGFWQEISNFLGNTWNWIVSIFTPQQRTEVVNGERREFTEKAPIVGWLEGIWKGITDTWDKVKGWGFWQEISNFLGNTWDWIARKFQGGKKVAYVNGERREWTEKAPVVGWLEGIWAGIQTAWNSIVGWEGWTAVSQFIGNTWSWIVGLVSGNSDASAGSDVTPASTVQETGEVLGEVQGALNDVPVDDQTEQRMSLIERIMDKLGEFWEKIKEVFGGFADHLGLETYKDAVVKLFGALGDILNVLATIISDIAGMLNRVINGGATSLDIERLLEIIGGGALIALIRFLFLENRATILEAASGQSLGTQFLEIGAGILLLAEAINLLGNLDTGQLLKGAGAVVILGLVMSLLVKSLTGLTEAKTSLRAATATPTTGLERFGNNLIKWVGLAAIVKIVIDQIVPIINALGEHENVNGEDIMKILLGLTALIAGVGLIAAVIGKMDVGFVAPIKSMAGVAIGMIAALAIIIFGLIGLVELLNLTFPDESAITGFEEKAENGGRLIAAVVKAMGYIFGSGVGGYRIAESQANNQIMNQTLESISTMADQYDAEKIGKIRDLVRLMGEIAAILEPTLGQGPAWDDISSKATQLGEALRAMLQAAISLDTVWTADGKPIKGTDENYQRLEDWLNLGLKLAQIMRDMNDVVETLYEGKYEQVLSRYGSGDSPFNAYIDTLQAIATAFQEGLHSGVAEGTINFDATPVITAIVFALGLGKTAIADAVRDMVQGGLDAFNQTGEDGNPTVTLPTVSLTGGGVDTSGLFGGLLGENGLFGENGMTSFMDQFIQVDENGEATSIGGMDLGTLTSAFDGAFGKLQGEIPTTEEFWSESGWLSFMQMEGAEGTGATGTLTEMTSQLQGLVDTMESAGELRITITPVFNFENLNRENLQAQLDAMPLIYKGSIAGPTYNADFSGLKSQLGLDQIQSKLDSINIAITNSGVNSVSAINTMSNRIDGVSSAIRGMELVLDTGVLVGQITPMIDVELWNRSRRQDRTGTIRNVPVPVES